jgi:predicted acylesterase/phospholipase RssA
MPMKAPESRDGRQRPARPCARHILVALVVGLGLAVCGCTTVLTRYPVPKEYSTQLSDAAPYGISTDGLRYWGDNISEDDLRTIMGQKAALATARQAASVKKGQVFHSDMLALSGGGADGAFGAGLLAGWEARGDRPDFRLVTGVSTGAIVALFAFLGPKYDETLKLLYTTHTTSDLTTRTIFAGLTGGTALFSTKGYRHMIDEYVNDTLVAELADKYSKGHFLLIGTTNLDASRPVIWNVTAIAATGDPSAKLLIRDIIQASSAIPAAFPPVLIPVTVKGEKYDEMHVDGGATQQVMLFSPEISLRELDAAFHVNIDRTLYVIINNKLRKPYDPVRPRLWSIASKAISSLISGSGTGDIYKIYAIALRDGVDLRVTWIPEDFSAEPDQMFDPVYMTALYDYGFAMGKNGVKWEHHPPDFVELSACGPGRKPAPGCPPLEAAAAPATQ